VVTNASNWSLLGKAEKQLQMLLAHIGNELLHLTQGWNYSGKYSTDI